jgi:hypothetical protein
MNTLIQLDKWVEQTRVNCVEIYLSKHIGQNTDTSVVDISTDAETKSLLGKFGKGSFNKFKNYYHKDYQYSYDLSNDAQRVTKKIHTYDKYHTYIWYNIYQVSHKGFMIRTDSYIKLCICF